MAIEIERKFLVAGSGWRADAVGSCLIRQGYLSQTGRSSVRVRVIGDTAARLTIKSAAAGIERQEFEYPIPVSDAAHLLGLCEGQQIVKIRHVVPFAGLTWEVDVFEQENDGLVVAEVELTSLKQNVDYPPWLGDEITHDQRYSNAGLALNPYASWKA